MGLYINPKESSKEDWLVEHGEIIFNEAAGASSPPKSFREGDRLCVCLVNNGGFTAAPVAYNQRELDVFAHPADQRDKVWFWVPLPSLTDVLGLSTDDILGARHGQTS